MAIQSRIAELEQTIHELRIAVDSSRNTEKQLSIENALR